jgi:RNA polymerase sigma-70 factor, ECF subfamily
VTPFPPSSTLRSVGLSVVPRPVPETDGELIAACIAGDAAAQRLLFRREYTRVNATVYRIIGVFRGLARFRGDAKLSTWIDRIAIRVVFHHLRNAKTKATLPLDVIGEIEGPGGSVDEQVHAREGLRRLYDALAELSPESRAAFALYAIDGRSIAEVARITGSTTVAVKCRIWRARREVMKRAAVDPVLAELVTEVVE